MKLKNITATALFVSLMIAGAKISIPIPPVPVTFQFMFSAMSGIFLGAKYGTISQLIYILLGLFGLPVFSGGGGIGYIFIPTFGFVIGFVFCALTTGHITEKTKKPSPVKYFLSAFTGLIVLNLIGAVYFYLIFRLYLLQPKTISYVLSTLTPFFIKDIAICGILAILAQILIPVLSKNNLLQREN